MTRAEHRLRAALGRGATQPPDWSTLGEQYEQISDEPVLYTCRNEANMYYGKTFDAKGRPYLPNTERFQKESEAINGIMEIMRHNAALERKIAASTEARKKICSDVTTQEWRRSSSFVYHAIGVLNETQRSCVNAIRQRLMAYESLSKITFVDMIAHDWSTYGARAFMLNGLPSRFYMRYAIDHGVLYPYASQLYTHLKARHPEQLWVHKVCRWVYFVSYHTIASLIIVNGELQDLRLLQPSTIRRPFPLIRCLHSLSRSDWARTFFLTIAPIYAVRWIFVVKTGAPTAISVRKIMKVYRGRKAIFLGSQDASRPTTISQRLAYWTSDLSASIRAAFASVCLPRANLKRGWWKDFLTHFRDTRWDRDTRWHRETAFEQIRDGQSPALHQWPEMLQHRRCAQILEKMLQLPFYFISARLITGIALSDPMLSALPHANALRADLYLLLPRLSSFTSFVGLRSTGRFVGKILLTFCLQTAVSGILVSVESAVALFFLRTTARRKKRLLRRGPFSGEELCD